MLVNDVMTLTTQSGVSNVVKYGYSKGKFTYDLSDEDLTYELIPTFRNMWRVEIHSSGVLMDDFVVEEGKMIQNPPKPKKPTFPQGRMMTDGMVEEDRADNCKECGDLLFDFDTEFGTRYGTCDRCLNRGRR